MAVSAPPKKKEAPAKVADQDKTIESIISRGSSTVVKRTPPEPEHIKHFNLKIMAGQLAIVAELRAYRPRKPMSPKLAISLQDWILEAIEEKIEREQEKYNLGVKTGA